ncbi:hypothetical protein MHH81_21115 [Psychrobacillus sp. FSL H8-0484]|uniref:hypothetical protein n=1 Tax=Psychrobacillus sp. FSL H8-0484 TaxID=2921390 RepID=UPI0030FD062A
MYRTIKSHHRKIVIHDIPSEVRDGKETMSFRAALMTDLYARENKHTSTIHYISYKEIESRYKTLSMEQLLQAK